MALLFSLLTLFGLPLQDQPESGVLPQYSDTLVARSWDVEDGLPVNTVNLVAQDQDGFIWFTTYDGIVRFNGLEFEVFNRSNTPAIPRNRAVLIHEQEGTGMWVSLENSGAVLFQEDGEVKHFDETDGFTSSNVNAILEDSKNRIWFATNQGLYKYRDGTFSRTFDREAPSKNRVFSIYEDTDGTIWAATFDGLIHITQNDVEVYNRKPGTEHNEITVISRYNEESLWVGTRTGLFLLEDGNLIRPDSFKPFEDEYITAVYHDEDITLVSSDGGLYLYKDQLIQLATYDSQYLSYQNFYRDSKGTLWMIRNNGNIARLKGREILTLDTPSRLAEYHINRIMEDREGNLWLSTARSGLVRLKQSRAKVLGTREGLSGNNILGLFEDSKGRFWVGTRDKGLNIIDGNDIKTYREEGKIASDIVHAIAEDTKGNVWVGYYQRGIQKFSDAGIESYDLGFDAGVNDVHAIHVSADSTIWLGTYGGLVKFDPEDENHTVYTEDDGLTDNLVRYIDEDPKGGLWIATANGGVSYFKDGSFRNYSIEQGLSSNNIRSVYVDENDPGTIWIGTENRGLNRLRDDTVSVVGVEDGLPDHIIHYISQDQNGWLWMSSNKGVIKVNKSELNSYLDGESSYFGLIHFGREAGMRNAECNGGIQQGGLRTSNGQFWFSTQEGVAIFDTNPSYQNTVEPEIYLTGINANGRTYTTSNVDLEAGVDDFTINFHALTFVNPESTPFRYKLEGYDHEWTEVRSKRQITYNNLPAGNYTFKVLGANNNGVWSSQPATASIHVNPLFYERPWFYLLAFILLVLGYYGVSHVRYRYLMNRQKEMEQIIEEQTAKLRKERDEIRKQKKIIEKQARKLKQSNNTKDKFFSIIGHDLRNPFQALFGFTQYLLENFESMERDEIKRDLQNIQRSSDRLLTLAKNLLNWATLQNEEVEPDPEWFNLQDLIEDNMQIFSRSARKKEIQLRGEGESNVEIYADRNMINTIIRNLLSNAIKFTGQGGTVTIKTIREEDICHIKISDTGVGMSPELEEKLMQLDENATRDGTDNETGTGLGLIICKDMVSLHGGDLSVDSVQGEGTTFTVSLPQNAFAEYEES